MWTRSGSSDATTQVVYAMYEVTLAASGTSGYAVTLGSVVANSATPATTVPARGAVPLQVISSGTFSLDNSKIYAVVTTLSVASLPASVVLGATGNLQTRG
jgi:hypothetical protein